MTDKHTDAVEVTRADIVLAAALYEITQSQVSGHWQKEFAVVVAEARHRIAHSTPADQEPVAWRVDDLTSKGALCDSFTIYTSINKVEQHVRVNGNRHTKVTPLYAAPPASPDRNAVLEEAGRLSQDCKMMADGLRGSMWANRDEIIGLLDRASAALRARSKERGE